MSLTLRARSILAHAALSSDKSPADTGPITVRGRRRAESRHRRTHGSTLPTPLAISLRFGVPGLVILALTAAQASAFALAPDPDGSLPRPLTLVAVLLLPLAVVVAARRIGISMLGAVTAAAFATATPGSVLATGEGFPEHLAVLALLAALAVGATSHRTARNSMLAAAAVGALGAGALTASGLTTAALPFLGWQLIRSGRASRRDATVEPLLAAGLAAIAVLACCLALGFGQQADGGAAGFDSIRNWMALDPVRIAVGLASLAVALLNRRLRPLALAVLTLLAFAQLPGLTDPLAALVIVAPGLALLTGAALDRSLVALGGRDRRPRLLGVAGVGMAAIALLASTAGWGLAVGKRTGSAEATAGSPQAEAAPAAPAASERPTPPQATDTPTSAPVNRPEDRLQRAEDGRQLLANPRLEPSAKAAELLADGQVDRRIAIVLGQLLADHDVTVADFPALEDQSGPRRQLLVTAMDGDDLAAGGASIPTLSAYLSGLAGEFAVESVTVDGKGVLATFPEAEDDTE